MSKASFIIKKERLREFYLLVGSIIFRMTNQAFSGDVMAEVAYNINLFSSIMNQSFEIIKFVFLKIFELNTIFDKLLRPQHNKTLEK